MPLLPDIADPDRVIQSFVNTHVRPIAVDARRLKIKAETLSTIWFNDKPYGTDTFANAVPNDASPLDDDQHPNFAKATGANIQGTVGAVLTALTALNDAMVHLDNLSLHPPE